MSEPLLRDSIPELAQELETLLNGEGQPDLAAQIREIRILERCPCGGCATFTTLPRNADGSWNGQHWNLMLQPASGWLILDVVDNRIAGVEVLDRDEYLQKLEDILPLRDQVFRPETPEQAKKRKLLEKIFRVDDTV